MAARLTFKPFKQKISLLLKAMQDKKRIPNSQVERWTPLSAVMQALLNSYRDIMYWCHQSGKEVQQSWLLIYDHQQTETFKWANVWNRHQPLSQKEQREKETLFSMKEMDSHPKLPSPLLNTNMSELWYKVWLKEMSNKNLQSPLQLKVLSLTNEAFIEHVYQAHIQTALWKSTIESDPPHLNPIHLDFFDRWK